MKTLEPGEILDHYRIELTVARSGMATIYRAVDLRDNQAVAIKVPHPEMEADPILSSRFRREQEIGLTTDHPGVLRMRVSHAEDEGTGPRTSYMVTEWVEGQLLRQVMDELQQLPIDRAVALTIKICDVLEYLHKHGIVHRDLKPENIMLDAEDNIKLIDFGIAMKENERRITFTSFSQTLGTPDYISPEQVQGKRADARSDLYALGVILYEMLTGTVPFAGENPFAVMNARVIADVPALRKLRPEVSPALEEILYRALERDPHHRYSTAHEFQWDLEHQELVGIDEGRDRASLRRSPSGRRLSLSPRAVLYLAIAAVPLALFALMLLIAHTHH